MSKASGRKMALMERRVMVPPFQVVIGGLLWHSNYSVRIRCANEVGLSPFSSWMNFQTPESGITTTYVFLLNLRKDQRSITVLLQTIYLYLFIF